eukprot:175746-Pyramimonas_sp.AAC.1
MPHLLKLSLVGVPTRAFGLAFTRKLPTLVTTAFKSTRFAKLGARRHPVDGAAMERLSRSRIVVEHIGKYI